MIEKTTGENRDGKYDGEARAVVGDAGLEPATFSV
jgi:hypothetical protein